MNLFEERKTTVIGGVEYWVERCSYHDTKHLILNVHYAKRMPSISHAFALMTDEGIAGVVTYGSPASPWLAKGVCGEESRHLVLELNRLVLAHNKPNLASYLVGASLRMLPTSVVVSYADSAQGHTGYVYQACNFLFTGTTKARTDMASENGKHSRHHQGDRTSRVDRSSKHRYVIFTGSPSEKRRLAKRLKYEVLPYPKTVSDF